MKLRRRRRGAIELVRLEVPGGSFDPAHPDRLHRELGASALEARDLILDLALVERMTSSGIGALITARRQVRARGGRLVLAGLGDEVRDVLRKLRIEHLFVVVEDAEAALERLDEPPDGEG